MSERPSDATTLQAGGAGPARRRYLTIFEPSSSRVMDLPERGRLVLGRGLECGLRLDDGAASRKHAELSIEPERITLADLRSQNGTLLDGRPVERAIEVRPGAVIRIGDTEIVLHVPAALRDRIADRDRMADPSVQEILRIGDREILIADPAMKRMYALIERIAPSDLPVLVQGETGAGKELVALAVHHFSKRRARKLVTLNCAAVPDALAESELFGHERGAFTGAVASKPGLLEAATGGTLLLDEAGELSLAIQAKLLRALETQRVTRVGDVTERAIDVRIVAATHRELLREVAAGRFRQDLYYRLAGATLHVPPLRDRPQEMLLLAQRFLDAACARAGRGPMRIGAGGARALAERPWPGNVRELRNAMDFVGAAFSDAELGAEHLEGRGGAPPAAAPGQGRAPEGRPLEEQVRELERDRIARALEASGGNQRKAAKALGMPLRTLVSKLARYGLRQRDGR